MEIIISTNTWIVIKGNVIKDKFVIIKNYISEKAL